MGYYAVIFQPVVNPVNSLCRELEVLTLMLLVANLAITKWREKP